MKIFSIVQQKIFDLFLILLRTQIVGFQFFSMFSIHPSQQNLPTYPEKTNKKLGKNNIAFPVLLKKQE